MRAGNYGSGYNLHFRRFNREWNKTTVNVFTEC